jgi:hypothetical protein
MKRTVLLAFLFLFFAGLCSAQRKTTLSVMDINATSGLSQKEIALLTDKLLNSLVEYRVYDVVERSKRDEILKEQGFQMTGACDQTSCLVEVGQLLGAQKMVGGTIGKLGSVYAVELRMIDIKTGKIDLTFSKNYSGDVSALLDAMKQAGEVFSRWRPGEGAEDRKGGLVIVSTPEEAKVSIDGKEYGNTPTYVYPMDAGLHNLVVIKEGYNLYTEGIAVKPGTVDTLNITLVRPVGTLTIYTKPSGAKIYLNGEYKGTTGGQGLKIDNLKKQSYDLSIKKPGYREATRSLKVDVGATKIEENLYRPKLLFDVGGGLIAQGIIGKVDYSPVQWMNGEGGGGLEVLFETSLGYRINRFVALKAGYQYHTGWATNEGQEAVQAFNKEIEYTFGLPAVTLGAMLSTQTGRFEPYLEARIGILTKAAVNEKIDSTYTTPAPIIYDRSYSCSSYKNYQIILGGIVWFSTRAAFSYSFRYNYESIGDLPNAYNPDQQTGDFGSWTLANHWGLMFAF